MHFKNCLSVSAVLLAFSQSSLAVSVRRAEDNTTRTSPLLGSFPGQGALPSLSQVSLQSASSGDSLPVDNIQGDILVGMKKLNERFLFFHINDAASFKTALKSYAVANITSIATLLSDPSAQPLAFVNMGFSAVGKTALGVTDDLGDAEYATGQFADAPNLGDDTSLWESEFKGTNIDGVFLIGSDQETFIQQYEADIGTIFGSSITVSFALSAAARPGAEQGHEHFGFLDGISNPTITGFGTALPGQFVAAQGVILTGRTGDTVTRPSWALDGSFMAFRKLKQLVPEFNKFTIDNALQNDGNNLTVQEGADLLGSRMIGRWKSGAPIDLTPLADDPALGADPQRNNNFNFTHAGFDLSTDQSHCPFSAHIRKTNPRADLNGADAVNHAIRAGTPYGPEVSSDEASSNTTSTDRGLAFVIYQSNIANGFHRQQAIWANNAAFPPNKNESAGIDSIIGQAATRETFGLNEEDFSEGFSVPQFVVPNGGEYFFMPSISSIVGTFAA